MYCKTNMRQIVGKCQTTIGEEFKNKTGTLLLKCNELFIHLYGNTITCN